MSQSTAVKQGQCLARIAQNKIDNSPKFLESLEII